MGNENGWEYGFEFGGQDAEVYVVSVDLPAGPTRVVDHRDVPWRPGGYAYPLSPASASISVQFALVAQSSLEFESALAALNSLLSPAEAQYLRFHQVRPNRQWLALPRGEMRAQYRGGRMAMCSVEFLAVTGLAEATEPTSVTKDIDGEVQFTIHPSDSTARCDTSVTIINGGSVTETDISVSNAATGESFTWRGYLEPVEYLLVQSRNDRVSASGRPDAAGDMDSGWDAITLLPQEDNFLTVSGVAEGSVTVTYRETFA